MNRSDDYAYYSLRADQERERAGRATDPAIAAVHGRLAAEYEKRCLRMASSEQRTQFGIAEVRAVAAAHL